MKYRNLAVLLLSFAICIELAHAQTPGPRFEISFPASAHAGAITGRVFVMISNTDKEEPRLQIGRTGVPFFGRDIEQLAPGQTAVIDSTDLGSPNKTLRALPRRDSLRATLLS